jgi:hypothetical protein
MDLGEIFWSGMDCSGLGFGPVVGFCEHGSEPAGSIICWELLE